MTATVALLAALALGGEHTHTRQSRPFLMIGGSAIMLRHAADPSGFSPHFGRSDPAAHAVRFLSGSSYGDAEKAQRLGLEKDKELSARLARGRLPGTMQFQYSFKAN